MKMISRLLGNAIRYVMRQNRAKMTDRSTIPCNLSRQKGITGWAPESVAGSGSAANGEQDLGLDCDRARQRNPVRSRPTRHENPVRDSRIITADRSTTWTRSRPVFPTRNLGVHGFSSGACIWRAWDPGTTARRLALISLHRDDEHYRQPAKQGALDPAAISSAHPTKLEVEMSDF